jgi:hypothetical protein
LRPAWCGPLRSRGHLLRGDHRGRIDPGV